MECAKILESMSSSRRQPGSTNSPRTMGKKAGSATLCEPLINWCPCRECAEILESMKQLSEAAQLYESSAYYDKVRLILVP